MDMTPQQQTTVLASFQTLKERSPFYAKKFEGIDLRDVKTLEDFRKLPFTDKGDLREAYPLGLAAVPEEKIVRIHSSSGTTGTPVIIPYTKKDIEDWAIQFARCYQYAGVTPRDRVQITPGYGLWTAGIGFQAGVERLGAMAVPLGPGNTDKQLQMMMDMKSTVLCATSSYALLLAEEIERRGIGDKICLRKGIIGSERWGEKMRARIAGELGAPASASTAAPTAPCTSGAITCIWRSWTRRPASRFPTARLVRSCSPRCRRKAPRWCVSVLTTSAASSPVRASAAAPIRASTSSRDAPTIW